MREGRARESWARAERSDLLVLSTAELFLLWTVAELGEPPALFGLRRIGRTRPARDAMIEQASHRLAARGLGTVATPRPDLAEMLRVLAAPRRSLDLVAEPSGLRAIAASAGTAQVTCAVAGTGVWIGPIRNTTLSGSLLEAVPPAPAGPGRTANLRRDDYRRACARAVGGSRQDFLDELRGLGLRQPEAYTVLRALTGRTGGGQFGATSNDGQRGGVRVGHPVSWLDTDDGRYALWEDNGWTTVTPASQAKLAELVAALA